MLQRIQSIFLTLALLVNLSSLFVPLWQFQFDGSTEYISGMGINTVDEAGQSISSQSFTENLPHMIFFGLCVAVSAFIAFVIFQYSDRKKQIRLCYFAILGLFIEILSIVFLTLKGPYLIGGPSGEGTVMFGFAFPAIAVFLMWIAYRRIKADEELVRSVDRIR